MSKQVFTYGNIKVWVYPKIELKPNEFAIRVGEPPLPAYVSDAKITISIDPH